MFIDNTMTNKGKQKSTEYYTKIKNDPIKYEKWKTSMYIANKKYREKKKKLAQQKKLLDDIEEQIKNEWFGDEIDPIFYEKRKKELMAEVFSDIEFIHEGSTNYNIQTEMKTDDKLTLTPEFKKWFGQKFSGDQNGSFEDAKRIQKLTSTSLYKFLEIYNKIALPSSS